MKNHNNGNFFQREPNLGGDSEYHARYRANSNQFHYYDSTTEPRPYHPISKTNYGIAVAILCICVWQFHGPILTWRLPFWGKSVTDIVFEIWDYARSYLQMAMEILRNMRLLLTSSMGMFGREDVDVATRDTSRSNNGKNKRRRIFHEASSMPGLEEDPAVTITIAQQKGQSHSDAKLSGAPAAGGGNDDETTLPVKATRVNRDNIEPAFLKDEDYPPGWLVYHPVLGVVPKTEADQYMK